ncbi:acyl carrier protein [Methylobacterium sp. E-046]|uniref:acyl carrier protein n=1 Tax=Methylobacterium sp. E-046 TaxID=2836576 RepID=UPI001FBAAF98|nr:acyl carrier protein [Methylobacterium sp. E-046]MCJ2101914.1 acyl carrier protein [Methylobacterium sp. E-046]
MQQNEKLQRVFRDVFDDPTIELEPTMTADDIAEWDSLSHVRLMLEVSKAFGVRFSASEVSSLNNVGDLQALISSKGGA